MLYLGACRLPAGVLRLKHIGHVRCGCVNVAAVSVPAAACSYPHPSPRCIPLALGKKKTQDSLVCFISQRAPRCKLVELPRLKGTSDSRSRKTKPTVIMAEISPKEAFQLVDKMVQGWALTYSHHIQVITDGGNEGIICSILFSKPTDDVPVPPHLAVITAAVVSYGGERKQPAITYALEFEMMQRPGSEPLQESCLDTIIARKIAVGDRVRMFSDSGKLSTPQPFVSMGST